MEKKNVGFQGIKITFFCNFFWEQQAHVTHVLG